MRRPKNMNRRSECANLTIVLIRITSLYCLNGAFLWTPRDFLIFEPIVTYFLVRWDHFYCWMDHRRPMNPIRSGASPNSLAAHVYPSFVPLYIQNLCEQNENRLGDMRFEMANLMNLPNAFNFPEWKSSNRPSKAFSIWRTSGISDTKEWCFIERVSKLALDCVSIFVCKSLF